MREARLIKGYEKVFYSEVYQMIILPRALAGRYNFHATDLFFI